MSELWNTPRGEFLYELARAANHTSPDNPDNLPAVEPAIRAAAFDELQTAGSPDQMQDMVEAATAFLRAQGKTAHRFSAAALARACGRPGLFAADMSMRPADNRLKITRAYDLGGASGRRPEDRQTWQGELAAAGAGQENTGSPSGSYIAEERIDSFLIGHNAHERSQFVSVRPNADYTLHRMNEPFTAADYLDVRYMIAADAGELD